MREPRRGIGARRILPIVIDHINQPFLKFRLIRPHATANQGSQYTARVAVRLEIRPLEPDGARLSGHRQCLDDFLSAGFCETFGRGFARSG